MADSVLFEVDAASIIAKLHLAGLQAAKPKLGANSFIVNTGIQNDNPSAKPDNPGKVTFDLKNASGEYEVGYVTWFEYKNQDAVKTMAKEAIQKLQNLIKDTSGEDSKIDDSSADPKVKKRLEQIDNQKKTIQSLLDDTSIALDSEDDLKKAIESIEKIDTKKAFDTAAKKQKAEAAEVLTLYMTSFAGKDAIKAAQIQNPRIMQVAEAVKNSNDKSLVSNFEIKKADQAEIDRLNELFKSQVEKNPKDMMYKQHVCYSIKYSLNVDK